MIVSSGAPQLLTGSAQLSTTGKVSGFVIFRHNNQEAVVPLESRNANAYILAFDNTGETFTGIAVNSVSAQAVIVPVIVRDDTGAQIATDALNLAANGHSAFTLVTDRIQSPPTFAALSSLISLPTLKSARLAFAFRRRPHVYYASYTGKVALASKTNREGVGSSNPFISYPLSN